MLVQAKGFASQAFNAIARYGRAEGTGRDREPEARVTFIIGKNRQTEKRVAQSLAALPKGTKFGRLMQSLARLERQPLGQFRRSLESPAAYASGTEQFAALRAAASQQCTAALGGHARTKAMRSGTMQITGIKSTFHGAASGN
jgi:hypothetical protein